MYWTLKWSVGGSEMRGFFQPHPASAKDNNKGKDAMRGFFAALRMTILCGGTPRGQNDNPLWGHAQGQNDTRLCGPPRGRMTRVCVGPPTLPAVSAWRLAT